jgi:hypothetical protein
MLADGKKDGDKLDVDEHRLEHREDLGSGGARQHTGQTS